MSVDEDYYDDDDADDWDDNNAGDYDNEDRPRRPDDRQPSSRGQDGQLYTFSHMFIYFYCPW